MWIWCLASVQSPPPPVLLLHQPPPPHVLPFPPLRSTPSRNLTVSAGKNISGLGHSLIAALNPTPKKQNQDEEEEDGRQMSGSDVLWALERAAATRKSKSAKKRAVPSPGPGSRRKEDHSDYSDVKPLIIKSDWSAKLDDLDKRLQELSDMV